MMEELGFSLVPKDAQNTSLEAMDMKNHHEIAAGMANSNDSLQIEKTEKDSTTGNCSRHEPESGKIKRKRLENDGGLRGQPLKGKGGGQRRTGEKPNGVPRRSKGLSGSLKGKMNKPPQLAKDNMTLRFPPPSRMQGNGNLTTLPLLPTKETEIGNFTTVTLLPQKANISVNSGNLRGLQNGGSGESHPVAENAIEREAVSEVLPSTPKASNQNRHPDYRNVLSPEEKANLRKEMQSFLMSTLSESRVVTHGSSREGGRKRVKSRKLLENENLLHELDDAKCPKANSEIICDKVIDETVLADKEVTSETGLQASTSDNMSLQLYVSALKPSSKVNKELDFHQTSDNLEEQTKDAASKSTPPFNRVKTHLIGEPILVSKVNAEAVTPVSTNTATNPYFMCELGHTLTADKLVTYRRKEKKRPVVPNSTDRSLLPGHVDITGSGGITGLPISDAVPLLCSKNDDSYGIQNTIVQTVSGFIYEIVEDWQCYCPYAPFSPYLDHVYVNGLPEIITLPLFGSSRTSSCTDKSHPDYYDLAIHVGGSVWSLDWCPQRQSQRKYRTEFLAIAAHPYSSPTHRLGEPVNGKCLIQIWAFNVPSNFLKAFSRGRPKAKTHRGKNARQKNMLVECKDQRITGFFSENDMDTDDILLEETEAVPTYKGEQVDLPQMVLGIAHDGGHTWDAKWQPLGDENLNYSNVGQHHLGYLAAVLGDGSLQVFDIPFPSYIRQSKSHGNEDSNLNPLIVRMKPVFKCSGLSSGKQKSIPLVLEWSSDLLLVGCHDGVVALWKFEPKPACDNDTRPLMCFVADCAPIRTVAFSPESKDNESKNILVTGGHSGRLLFWDIRDPFHPLWDLTLSKGGCILSIDWFTNPRGLLLAMDDGSIKTLSIGMASSDNPVTGTLCSKPVTQGLHSVLASSFAIWTVQFSRESGIAMYAGEDGSVVRFQLTERFLNSDRTRAKEPHYMCCKFTEEPSTSVLSIASHKSRTPVQLKKYRPENSQIPLSRVVSKQSSGGIEAEQSESKKNRKKSASRSLINSSLRGKERICGENETVVSVDEDSLALISFDKKICRKGTAVGRSIDSKEDVNSLANEAQGMPPKSVSMHRLRWNPNKGCESMVCFGGAAGIVRIQIVTQFE